MSTVETPSSTSVTVSVEANALPSWLNAEHAADLLRRVSSILGRQCWPRQGELRWCGWGGPSAELVASMPGRWVVVPAEAPEPEQSEGSVEMTTIAGAHLMVERMAADRAARLDGFFRLWDVVTVDGLIAYSYLVQAGSEALETERSAGHGGAIVDHRQLIGELLEATAGRLLTDDLVVHHPDSVAAATWATLVLRRLG